MMENGLYSILVEQDPCKFLLDLSNKSAIETNSHYIKLISLKKDSIKCPTAMRTPGNPCNNSKHANKKKKNNTPFNLSNSIITQCIFQLVCSSKYS